jgi:hypothetical protein
MPRTLTPRVQWDCIIRLIRSHMQAKEGGGHASDINPPTLQGGGGMTHGQLLTYT